MQAAIKPSVRRRLSQQVVPHSQYVEAMTALEELRKARVEDDWVEGMYITAPSGTGKTFVREQFTQNNPAYETFDRTIIPVLAFSMPVTGGIKAMLQAALAAMGAPTRGTIPELEHRLVALLIACKVLIVFIDEAQHFVHRMGRKGQISSADSFKNLMSLARVSVVMMGTEILTDVMAPNEQLRRRFSRKVRMKPWCPTRKEDLNEVARVTTTLLTKAEVELDFQALLNPVFIGQLIYASGGRMGYLVKLLVEACVLAERSGDTKLKVAHFETAFQHVVWDEADATTNPFNDKFCPTFLDQPGQPFWVDA